jgi:hypothetical protein
MFGSGNVHWTFRYFSQLIYNRCISLGSGSAEACLRLVQSRRRTMESPSASIGLRGAGCRSDLAAIVALVHQARQGGKGGHEVGPKSPIVRLGRSEMSARRSDQMKRGVHRMKRGRSDEQADRMKAMAIDDSGSPRRRLAFARLTFDGPSALSLRELPAMPQVCFFLPLRLGANLAGLCTGPAGQCRGST